MSKDIRNKEHNKSSVFGKLMFSIVILGIVILLFINFALPVIKKSAKKIAAEKTLELIAENSSKFGGEDLQLDKILDNMSEEDKETLTGIIENHMDADSVKEVMGYVTEGDKEGMVKYATDTLTPQEMIELMKLYGKYAN